MDVPLCFITGDSFLTHISVCCVTACWLHSLVNEATSLVRIPLYSKYVSYLPCPLTCMFNTYNQGHCTSRLPFFSLNLETWHLIYLLHGLETIYRINLQLFYIYKFKMNGLRHRPLSNPAALFVPFQTWLHPLSSCVSFLLVGFGISVRFHCKIFVYQDL